MSTVSRDLRIVVPMNDDYNKLPPEGEQAPKSKKKIGTVIIVLALIGIIVYFHDDVSRSLKAFVLWCKVLGPFAGIVYALLVGLLNLLMLPIFPLMVGAGLVFPMMYGPHWGVIIGVAVVFSGLWLGSMVAFVLGRKCFKGFAEKELEKIEWMKVINSMINQRGWSLVLILRMSPLLPAEIFNYAASLTDLSIASYGIGCLGSIVPVALWVITAATGQAAASEDKSLITPEERARQSRHRMMFIGGNILFVIFITVVLYFAFNEYKKSLHPAIDELVNSEDHEDDNAKALRKLRLLRSCSSFKSHDGTDSESVFERASSWRSSSNPGTPSNAAIECTRL